jgi:5'-3' exonuclease
VSTPIPKSIALVDFFHMLTVNFKAMANDDGPNKAGQVTIDQLGAIRSASEHVVVCVDSPPYWRKAVYPDYKKGREREPEFGAIVQWTLERVAADGYNIARAPNQEADDVMATLAREFEAEGCSDVRIVGADKDALQCLTDGVRCFIPKGRGEFEIRDLDWFKKAHSVEEQSITPSQFAMYLAICGDTSDHIPGIKGIGHVGAIKLIATYGTFEKMAEACVAAVNSAKVGGKLPAFWRNYNQGMAELPRWLRLTTLNDAVDLELHPLKYLEKLPVQKLVEDDDVERDAIQNEGMPTDEDMEMPAPDWSAIEDKVTAEQERLAMAAALPVGAVNVSASNAAQGPLPDLRVPSAQPLVGADPNAAEILKQKAAERSAKVSPVQETINAAAAEARQRAAEGKVDETGRPKASTTDQAAPPPAAEPQSAAASAGAASGPVAEVVPTTRGPRKVEPIPAPEGGAIVVAPPSWALAAQPRTASELFEIAKKMVNSRAHAAYGSAEGCFNAMSLGRELGLGYATSLDAFHLYNNKPLLKAVTYKALAELHPHCGWITITEADDRHAVIKTFHKGIGEVLTYEYTAERARKAGYFTGSNKENWNNKTQEMLEARVTTKSIRRWYASVIIGQRSLEEAEDGND